MGCWNVNGWKLNKNTDNYQVRAECVKHLNTDVIAVVETHLTDVNTLEMNGYKWWGHNRTNLNCRAKSGSGGVGIFVKDALLHDFNVSILDTSVEGIMWITFTSKSSDTSFRMCVCYLPPDGSSRYIDPGNYYNELLSQIYRYQKLTLKVWMPFLREK